jgi:hypothetical protein
MTRYRLFKETPASKWYLAACYEPQHDGIVFTPLVEDACEYVTVEKAAEIARTLIKLRGEQIHIEVSEDGK